VLIQKKSIKKIGLLTATGIVAGSMMSSGVALLPSDMAAIGSITIISWGIVFIGAIALAYVFARLGAIDPEKGGPVAYATELSPILGFQTGLMYWAANWVGNLAIAVMGVAYLTVFFPSLNHHPISDGLAAIGMVWIFTVLNFWGADKIAKMVSVSVVLLLIPVIGTAILGWTHFSFHQFTANWNVGHQPAATAIFSGVLLSIWSFIGVEAVSVDTALVENPTRTVPLATMFGTVLIAIIYVGAFTVIGGMYPAAVVAKSSAPFALSFGTLLGDWVKPFVSLFTAIACLMSLGSWMMVVGQAGSAAAQLGTLPKIFGKENRKGVPVSGLVINATLMTVLMLVIMSLGESSLQTFGELISIAALLTIFPYFYSALWLIKVAGVSRKTIPSTIWGSLAAIFCFVVISGAKKTTLLSMIIIACICFIFYAFKPKK
jgi:cadaverine:lysine antiporter